MLVARRHRTRLYTLSYAKKGHFVMVSFANNKSVLVLIECLGAVCAE